MPKIKAIGFDQGGVLMSLDYQKTIDQLTTFGARDVEKLYSQADQAIFFDQLERGEITPDFFREELRRISNLTDPAISDAKLDEAWSALLLDYNKACLDYVRELKREGYIVFLFTNINEIHYPVVLEARRRGAVEGYFSGSECCFHEQYSSHLFGHNKPYAESFRLLAKDLCSKHSEIKDPSEILFIDDSSKHIFGRPGHIDEGAIVAGWQGLVVPSNLSAATLRYMVRNKIQNYPHD